MTRRTETLRPGYFDGLYAASEDPWGFRTSDYEQRKYEATLEALTCPRYARALEVGCSIGVFTHRLAARCASLLAIDASAVALAEARRVCAAQPQIRFELRMVPSGFPEENFDLIVLSEVLYYLAASDLRDLAARCGRALAPGGEIVLCHWLGETDYPLTGLEAHRLFVEAARDEMACHVVLNHDTYRLDRLMRA